MTPEERRANRLFRAFCIAWGLLMAFALVCVVLAIGTMLTLH